VWKRLGRAVAKYLEAKLWGLFQPITEGSKIGCKQVTSKTLTQQHFQDLCQSIRAIAFLKNKSFENVILGMR